MNTHVLTISCPSRRGIVAAVATYLNENGCNIEDSSQFTDKETNQFFLRLSFTSEEGVTRDVVSENFADIAVRLAT